MDSDGSAIAPEPDAEGGKSRAARERAVLARLEPDGVANEGGWQQRKSARTRLAILEAAIKCLAENGYAHTTTKIVAGLADVSRGAMLHHYPTKRDLIDQVAAFTFFKRMERILGDFRALSVCEARNEALAVSLHWKNLHTLEYRAYLELCVAARSDEELREILEPRATEFEKVQLAELPKIFPEWADIPAQLTLANDLVMTALDGLLINYARWADPDRAENVRRLVARILYLLRTGTIKAEDL